MLRLPAEWEMQSAVLMAWPHRDSDFSDLAAVEDSYVAIAETILDYQRLVIVCRDETHRSHIATRLAPRAAQVVFVSAPYRDVWVRDTAPLSVDDGKRAALRKFRFNGWGNKYPCHDDDALGEALYRQGLFGDTPWQKVEMVLEGGSLDSDGRGTLLTTVQCLLNPNRNAGWSKARIEHELSTQLGATRVLWLDQPALAGDDTDAHVDTLARFCDAQTIAYTACDDEHDVHHASLQRGTATSNWRKPSPMGSAALNTRTCSCGPARGRKLPGDWGRWTSFRRSRSRSRRPST